MKNSVEAKMLIIVWICFFLVTGFLSVISLPHTAHNPKIYQSWQDYPRVLANWDGGNYLEIAQKGYSPGLYGFMPLYPLLIRLTALVIPNYVVSALIVSISCSVLALYFFQKLVFAQTGDKEITRKSLIYLLAFPTSFFLLTAYTESLFLFLTVASFYFAQQKKPLLAAIAVSLSLVTRITGIILVPVIIWEILKLNRAEKLHKAMSLVSIPLALFGFMLYLSLTVGDPLKFIHVQQSNFRTQTITNPFIPLVSYVLNFSPERFFTQGGVISLLEFLLGILVVALLIFGYKYLPRSQFLFGIGVWFLHLSTGITNSTLRYFLVIFPIIIILAYLDTKLHSKWFGIMYVTGGLSLGVVLMSWFLRGFWVA